MRLCTACSAKTKSTSRSALLLAAGVLAAGCVSMTDTECRTANWYELGERDGLHYGLRPHIDQYAYQCSRHGIQASEKDYMAGWVDGYREFIRRSSSSDCCAPN